MIVKNQGIDDAEDVRVEVFARSSLFGRRLVGRSDIEHLGPLSQAQVIVDVDTSSLAGVVMLEVVVDRLEKILELTDKNNTGEIELAFASDWTFDRDDTTLRIVGNASDNTISITDRGESMIEIVVGNLPAMLVPRADLVIVDSAAGNDQVSLNFLPPAALNFLPGVLSYRIHSGDGDDHVLVLHKTGNRFDVATSVDLGAGKDVFDGFAVSAASDPAGAAVTTWDIAGGADRDFLRLDDRRLLTGETHVTALGNGGDDVVDVVVRAGPRQHRRTLRSYPRRLSRGDAAAERHQRRRHSRRSARRAATRRADAGAPRT